MIGREGVLPAREMRRLLPGLLLAGISAYLGVTHFLLNLSVLLALGGLIAVAVALIIFLRPIWGFYILVGTFSAEFVAALNPVLGASKILGVAVFFSWALEGLFRRSYRLPKHMLPTLAVLFVLSAVVSGLVAENVAVVTLKLTTLVQLAMLVFIAGTILKDPAHVRNVAWIILVSTALSVGYGIVRGGGEIARPLEGFTDNRNRIGVIIALCIPIVFYLFPRVGPAKRLGLVFLAGLLAAGEVLTYSRGGFLALLFAVFLSVFFMLRRRQSRVLVGALVVLALVVSWGILPEEYLDRMATILPSIQEGTDTMGTRYDYWGISLKMLWDHPFIGVGVGNFTTQFTRYGGIIGLRRSATTAHSTFLGVAAEQGVVGALLFLGLLFWALTGFRRSWNLAREAGRDEVAALCLCFAFVLLVFISQMVKGSYEHNKYLWLILGICVALRGMACAEGEEAASEEATQAA